MKYKVIKELSYEDCASKFPKGWDKGICPKCGKECNRIGYSDDKWVNIFECGCGKQYGYMHSDMGQTMPYLAEIEVLDES